MRGSQNAGPTPDTVVGRFDGIACRGARAMLGITQSDLCDRAGVGRNLLNDFEMGTREPKASNVMKLRRVLEGLGAEFLDTAEGTVTVRLMLREPEPD